jgi:hypothetical protein
LQAFGADVPTVDFQVAQGTQEPPAGAAGHHGFFAPVKKTAGLPLGGQDFSAAALLHGSDHGRVDRRSEIGFANRTAHRLPGVKILTGQRGTAVWAV